MVLINIIDEFNLQIQCKPDLSSHSACYWEFLTITGSVPYKRKKVRIVRNILRHFLTTFWDIGKTRILAKFRGLFQNCPRKYIALFQNHPRCSSIFLRTSVSSLLNKEPVGYLK